MYAPYGIRAANNDDIVTNPFAGVYTNNSVNSGYPWLNDSNKSKQMLSADSFFGKKRKRSGSGYCLINGSVKKSYKRKGHSGRYYKRNGKFVKVPKGKKCYKSKSKARSNKSGSKKSKYVYRYRGKYPPSYFRKRGYYFPRKRSKSKRRRRRTKTVYRYRYRYYPRRRRVFWRRRWIFPVRLFRYHGPTPRRIITIRATNNPLVKTEHTDNKFGSSIDYNYAINQFATNAGTPSMKNLYQIGSNYFTEG